MSLPPPPPPPPALHVVLNAPDIPQNTGNVGRLCAITGAALACLLWWFLR